MKEYLLASTSGGLDVSKYKEDLFNTKEYRQLNLYTNEVDVITTITINNIEELERLKELKNDFIPIRGLIFSNRNHPDASDYDNEELDNLEVIEIYDSWRE